MDDDLVAKYAAEARAAMEAEAARLAPANPRPHKTLARVLEESGDFVAALEHYQAATRLDPADTAFRYRATFRELHGKTLGIVGLGGIGFEVARRARRVYAVDISSEIVKGVETPSNFELLPTDGFTVPDRKSTRLNSIHSSVSRMPSSA